MKLNKGEMICSECNGIEYIKIKKIYSVKRLCPLCLGNKKIDWIENITLNKTNPGKVLIIYEPHIPCRNFSIEYKKLDHQYIIKGLECGIISRVLREKD